MHLLAFIMHCAISANARVCLSSCLWQEKQTVWQREADQERHAHQPRGETGPAERPSWLLSEMHTPLDATVLALKEL